MTAADAAPHADLPQPPSLMAPSISNVSSPLSEVEEDDGDLDLEDEQAAEDQEQHTDDEDDDVDGSSPPLRDGSPDSILSDPSADDSEAETERLYDTPHRNTAIRHTADKSAPSNGLVNSDVRPRLFERSPSKLQQQIHAEGQDDAMSEDGGALSEDDDLDTLTPHVASNGIADDAANRYMTKKRGSISQPALRRIPRSPLLVNTTEAEDEMELDQPPAKRWKRSQDEISELSSKEDSRQNDAHKGNDVSETKADSRKRLNVDHGEDDAMLGDGGDQSEEEAEILKDGEDEHVLAEQSGVGTVDVLASAIIASERRTSRGKIVEDGDIDHVAEELAVSNDDALAAEEVEIEDDTHDVDVDDDIEAAQKNEEELERKRAAFTRLSSIEKHFVSFRERLYDDKLAQLNKQEAMLRSDKPTHPEYLAMAQCIKQRLDERLRVINAELQLNAELVQRWAVARRSEILSQYFQSVRETRELALEDLGRQWYEIQHERRRHVDAPADQGYRFPTSRTEQARQAIAHNKEVSILSGVARYTGFPAAPEMKGATMAEYDEDMEAIQRIQRPIQSSYPQQAQPGLQEYGGGRLGLNLGAAGEQFIEQTPWANPNHPSHQLSRRLSQQQQQQQQHHTSGASVPRKQGHRTNNRVPLVDTADHVRIAHSARATTHGHAGLADHDSIRPSAAVGEQGRLKREAMAQIAA